MDAKRYAPATERNRLPILEVLQRYLPSTGNVLEIAGGTGEHGVFFASQFPKVQWYPSDPNPEARASIAAWRNEYTGDNLQPPLEIDVMDASWSSQVDSITINTVVNINMIHISPWAACEGLIQGAGKLLSSGEILYLYGPYKREGKHTAPSNAAFDISLQSRNPLWGVRDLETVVAEANKNGLSLQEVVEMPANNLSVIFGK